MLIRGGQDRRRGNAEGEGRIEGRDPPDTVRGGSRREAGGGDCGVRRREMYAEKARKNATTERVAGRSGAVRHGRLLLRTLVEEPGKNTSSQRIRSHWRSLKGSATARPVTAEPALGAEPVMAPLTRGTLPSWASRAGAEKPSATAAYTPLI